LYVSFNENPEEAEEIVFKTRGKWADMNYNFINQLSFKEIRKINNLQKKFIIRNFLDYIEINE